MSKELIPTLQQISKISELLANAVRAQDIDQSRSQEKLANTLISTSRKNDGKGLSYALNTIFTLESDEAGFNKELEDHCLKNEWDDVSSIGAWNRYSLNEMAFDLLQKMAFAFYHSKDASYKEQKYAIRVLVRALTYYQKANIMLEDDDESVKLLEYLEPTEARVELINDNLLPVLELLNDFINDTLYDELLDLKTPLSSSKREQEVQQPKIIQSILKNTTLALELLKPIVFGNLSNIKPQSKELYCELAGMHADALRAKGLFFARSDENQSDALDDLEQAHFLYNKIEQIVRERLSTCRVTNDVERIEHKELGDLLGNIGENKDICRTQAKTLQNKINAQDKTQHLLNVFTTPSPANRTRKRLLESMVKSSAVEVENKRSKVLQTDETGSETEEESDTSDSQSSHSTQTARNRDTFFVGKATTSSLQSQQVDKQAPETMADGTNNSAR